MECVRDEIDHFAEATLTAHAARAQTLTHGQGQATMMDPGYHAELFASLMWLQDPQRTVIPVRVSHIRRRRISPIPPIALTSGDGCFALHITGDLLPHVRWMLVYHVHHGRRFDVPERFTAGIPWGLSLTEPCGMLRAVTNPRHIRKGRSLHQIQAPIQEPLTALWRTWVDGHTPVGADDAPAMRLPAGTADTATIRLVQVVSYALAYAPTRYRTGWFPRMTAAGRSSDTSVDNSGNARLSHG